MLHHQKFVFMDSYTCFVFLAGMCQGIKTVSRILSDTCVKWGMRYILYIPAAFYFLGMFLRF